MLRCSILVISLLIASVAEAQPVAPDIHNRVGAISDEVALQRLRSAGVENPRILRREDLQIVAQGTLRGRETTLRIDALRGAVIDTANPTALLVAPGLAVGRPEVTGRQLLQPRTTLADPSLMREAVRPSP
jgi:hypothetical protein